MAANWLLPPWWRDQVEVEEDKILLWEKENGEKAVYLESETLKNNGPQIDKQGPTIQHRELYLVLCNNLYGKRMWKLYLYI